jgi:hypothetical protein
MRAGRRTDVDFTLRTIRLISTIITPVTPPVVILGTISSNL